VSGGRAGVPGAVRVRAARPDEHVAVADVLEAAFTATFTITDWYRENLRRVPEHAATHDVWVAELPGSATFAGAVLTPHPAALRSAEPAPDGVPEFGFRLLGVAPTARGRGVGRALVAHTVGLARAQGLTRIGIRSGPQMRDAHRLYEQLGFVRRRERETLVVDGGQRLLVFTYDIPVPATTGAGR